MSSAVREHAAEAELRPLWVPWRGNWFFEGCVRLPLWGAAKGTPNSAELPVWRECDKNQSNVILEVNAGHIIHGVTLELCKVVGLQSITGGDRGNNVFSFKDQLYATVHAVPVPIPHPVVCNDVGSNCHSNSNANVNESAKEPYQDAQASQYMEEKGAEVDDNSDEGCDTYGILELHIESTGEDEGERGWGSSEFCDPGIGVYGDALQSLWKSGAYCVQLPSILSWVPQEWALLFSGDTPYSVFVRVEFRLSDQLLSPYDIKGNSMDDDCSIAKALPHLFTASYSIWEDYGGLTSCSVANSNCELPPSLCFTFLSSAALAHFVCPSVRLTSVECSQSVVCQTVVSHVGEAVMTLAQRERQHMPSPTARNGESVDNFSRHLSCMTVALHSKSSSTISNFAVCLVVGKTSRLRMRYAVFCAARNGEIQDVAITDEGSVAECTSFFSQLGKGTRTVARVKMYFCDCDEEQLLPPLIACYAGALGKWILHCQGEDAVPTCNGILHVNQCIIVTCAGNEQLNTLSRGVRVSDDGYTLLCSSLVLMELKQVLDIARSPSSANQHLATSCACLGVRAEVTLVGAILESLMGSAPDPLRSLASHPGIGLNRQAFCRAWACEEGRRSAKERNDSRLLSSYHAFLLQEYAVLRASGVGSVVGARIGAFLCLLSSSVFQQLVRFRAGLGALWSLLDEGAESTKTEMTAQPPFPSVLTRGPYTGFSLRDVRQLMQPSSAHTHCFMTRDRLLLRWECQRNQANNEGGIPDIVSTLLRISLVAPANRHHGGGCRATELQDPIRLPFSVVLFRVHHQQQSKNNKGRATDTGDTQRLAVKRVRGEDGFVPSPMKGTVWCSIDNCIDGIWNIQLVKAPTGTSSKSFISSCGKHGVWHNPMIGEDMDEVCPALEFSFLEGCMEIATERGCGNAEINPTVDTQTATLAEVKAPRPMGNRVDKGEKEVQHLLCISARALRVGVGKVSGEGEHEQKLTGSERERNHRPRVRAVTSLVVPVVVPHKSAVPLFGFACDVDYTATLIDRYPRSVLDAIADCCEKVSGSSNHFRKHSLADGAGFKETVMNSLNELAVDLRGALRNGKADDGPVGGYLVGNRLAARGINEQTPVPCRACCATSALRSLQGIDRVTPSTQQMHIEKTHGRGRSFVGKVGLLRALLDLICMDYPSVPSDGGRDSNSKTGTDGAGNVIGGVASGGQTLKLRKQPSRGLEGAASEHQIGRSPEHVLGSVRALLASLEMALQRVQHVLSETARTESGGQPATGSHSGLLRAVSKLASAALACAHSALSSLGDAGCRECGGALRRIVTCHRLLPLVADPITLGIVASL